jgi:hypothetical protein
MAEQTITYTITASPLPSNFRGTPQELFEAMLDRIEIESNAETFVIGSAGEAAPTENSGPWLKNGTKWYVWDENTSAYIPLDISDSLNPDIVISATTPDPEKTQVWAVLGTDSVTMLKFYLGAVLGWVEMDRELVTGAVTNDFIADNAVTRTKIKNGEVTADKLANDLPITKLEAGDAGDFMRTAADGTVVWTRAFSVSPILTLTANTSLEHPHGLPSPPNFVDAVLVCSAADNSFAIGDEFSIFGHGNANGILVYRNATKVGLQIPDNIQIREKNDPDGTANNIDYTKWGVKFVFGLC